MAEKAEAVAVARAQRRLREATDKLRDAEHAYDEALKEHSDASQRLEELEAFADHIHDLRRLGE